MISDARPAGSSAPAALQQARCPGCEHVGATAVGVREPLHLVRCPSCSLVYSHPAPVAAVAHKYVYDYDLAEHFATWLPRKRVLYNTRLLGLPASRPGRDALCDVGCADGQFLLAASERGWRPFGVELNPPAAARARELGLPVSQGTLEAADDLPWGTFDLVTSWDVLEHTPTPREFVRRLRRLVKPDGLVVVTTLNLASLAYAVFGLRWSMVCEDHFTYWSRKSLAALATREGFHVRSCHTFGLGRDFVTFLDRHRHDKAVEAASSPQGVGRRWDVNPLVIAAERTANWGFRHFGGGVGLTIELTPSR
jgi:SAM-dependent methyltransferase